MDTDAAKVRFFPPGIPAIAIALGALLQWYWPLHLGSQLPAAFRYPVGAAVVVVAVLVLGAWPVTLFRSGGQSANPWKPTDRLEMHGPYRFTRNPMYLQMVLVCVGVAIAFANGWILILVPAVVWALRRFAIDPEERYLEERFGEAYVAYKREVRRWL